ncbi:hypothetical protein RV18_GL001188 [Enterococcus termitis]|nr:hypothetical protein RV18_GL001188 [Enterococcus termitis]
MLVTTAIPFLTVYQLNQASTPFFISMLAAFCLIAVLFKSHFVKIPLYLFTYLYTLYHYFPLKERFGISWLKHFFDISVQAYFNMLSGEISYLPDFVAFVLILFLMIFLAILLIHYERWVFSYLLLVGYLLMLAVFNRLNLSWQVIIMTCSAVLFYKLKHSFHTNSKNKMIFTLLTSMLLGLTAASAYFFPIAVPKSKAFLFTQTAGLRTALNQQGLYQQINQYGINSSAMTGFSEDDSKLGGPMQDDQTALFTAKQSAEHYWRVETKNNYTGKGWNNIAKVTPDPLGQPLVISTNSEYQGAFKPAEIITFSFSTAKEYLPYPYGNSTVPFEEIGQTEKIEEKNRIILSDKPKNFQITWEEPDFSIESLQQVALETNVDIQTTQVPHTLPKRVQELAYSLTEDQETLYGKVKAVEQYLKKDGDYRYSKVDAAYTPESEDYVDYFLFDSKVGYCDNFSSAMTVLLRSVGIPSRWAKGFSSGERTSGTGQQKVYTIRNSDAHSWPEVYFEGFGWIPFEPTPSFTNNASPATGTVSSTTNESQSTTSESTTVNSTKKTKTTTESTTQDSQIAEKEKASNWPDFLRNIFWGFLVILLLISAYFLKKYYFILSLRVYLAVHPQQFSGAYIRLLKKAENILQRADNESLIMYATRFEKVYPQFHGSFYQLTELYEQNLYGKIKPRKSDYAGLLLHTGKLLTPLKQVK